MNDDSSPSSADSEDIEELIERKVEERVEEKLEELASEQSTREQPEHDGVLERVSRRKFVKLISVGAGGLALSSTASGWWSVGDNTGGGGSAQTLSDVLAEGNSAGSYTIDMAGNDIVDGVTTIWDAANSHIPSGRIQSSGLNADTVDGQHASDLSDQSVQRNSAGNAYIASSNAYPNSQIVLTPPSTTRNGYTDTWTARSTATGSAFNPASTYSNLYLTGTFEGSHTSFTGFTYYVTISVDNSQVAGSKGSTATTTFFGKTIATGANTVVTPNQTITWRARISAITTASTLGAARTGSAFATLTGNSQMNTGVGTTRSPVWVNWNSNTGNGNWATNRSAGGSNIPVNDYMLDRLTTGNSLVLTVSWSNVATTTTFTNTWTLKEGSFT